MLSSSLVSANHTRRVARDYQPFLRPTFVSVAVVILAFATPLFAQPGTRAENKPAAGHARTEDVIYGRRDGLALTMDVFTPSGKPNGAAVIICVSAKYRSGRELLNMFQSATTPFLDRGYMVFAVMHSSQPKYTVPDAIDDVHRSVRYIRANAKKYGIDPSKLGIAGGSAGGHLALMMGCASKAGDPDADDPVDRESSKVSAVACFFPPTDFVVLEGQCTKEFAAAFDFREFDSTSGKFVPVTPEQRSRIGQDVSPITHATKNAAPTLIIHGDQDKLVPIEQSKTLIAKLTNCGVDCELVVKPGKGHFWFGIDKDLPTLADWFDKHLIDQK